MVSLSHCIEIKWEFGYYHSKEQHLFPSLTEIIIKSPYLWTSVVTHNGHRGPRSILDDHLFSQPNCLIFICYDVVAGRLRLLPSLMFFTIAVVGSVSKRNCSIFHSSFMSRLLEYLLSHIHDVNVYLLQIVGIWVVDAFVKKYKRQSFITLFLGSVILIRWAILRFYWKN